MRKVEVLSTQPLIMVVDDSLTVRKVTRRLLTRAGYRVATAKDCVELVGMMPAVMLLDIDATNGWFRIDPADASGCQDAKSSCHHDYLAHGGQAQRVCDESGR
jgi:CheY-like chemotaxis protein